MKIYFGIKCVHKYKKRFFSPMLFMADYSRKKSFLIEIEGETTEITNRERTVNKLMPNNF